MGAVSRWSWGAVSGSGSETLSETAPSTDVILDEFSKQH